MHAYFHQLRLHPESEEYDGRALLFRARDMPHGFLTADPKLGWGGILTNMHSWVIPGDHTGILSEPNVQILAEHLQAAMNEARAKS